MHDVPSYISLSGLFKARPSQEGSDRVLYMEASNERVDLQGEKVLAKSLQDSSEHFLRYGNIDLDHRTLLAPAQAGDNPYRWEIGHPVAVSSEGGRTLVKALLYQGEGPMAENANLVWESLTRLSPPARWYPSVGGQVLERGTETDPLTKAAVPVIRRVRWTNIGLSRTPVNSAVSPVSTIPVEVFAKCLTAEGCLDLTKALEAGYGTDSAALSGGGALRVQSLDSKPQATLPGGVSYLNAREALARWARCTTHPRALAERLTHRFSLSPDEAARWVERFLRDLSAHQATPR
jgi:hypothetical protein